MTDYRKCAAGCGADVNRAGVECAACTALARVLRRPPSARGAGARQLDVFTGRDLRGVALQLDLFGRVSGGAGGTE